LGRRLSLLGRSGLRGRLALVVRAARALSLLLLLVVAGCTVAQPPPQRPEFPAPPTPYRLSSRVVIEDDWALDGLADAAMASERYFSRKTTAGPAFFELGAERYSLEALRASNRYLLNLLAAGEGTQPQRLLARLRNECRAYRATGRSRFTAYYEPVFEARRLQDAVFRWPLYAVPSDAAALTRRDIDGEAELEGRGLELFWLNDPVDRYFLHVQGSARLLLADGTTARVGYAASNGQPYVSIGRIMLDEGRVPSGKASADDLADWLRKNPSERDEILFRNPRYIFFQNLGLVSEAGPQGAFGESLVAGRSVAADSDYVPPGALLYMETHAPQLDQDGKFEGLRPLSRLALSHDRGSAIKGPGRIDIFWGTGPRAGAEAGFFSEAGRLWILVCGPLARPEPKMGQQSPRPVPVTTPTSRRRPGRLSQ
jgi:membrane-bound lytic murein transglycosylase A